MRQNPYDSSCRFQSGFIAQSFCRHFISRIVSWEQVEVFHSTQCEGGTLIAMSLTFFSLIASSQFEPSAIFDTWNDEMQIYLRYILHDFDFWRLSAAIHKSDVTSINLINYSLTPSFSFSQWQSRFSLLFFSLVFMREVLRVNGVWLIMREYCMKTFNFLLKFSFTLQKFTNSSTHRHHLTSKHENRFHFLSIW